MNILFLYTELADYTIACLKALKAAREDIRIKVIHYPVNPEAPFVFDFSGIGNFRCFNDYAGYAELKSDVSAFSPDIIVCSGWVNRSYVSICRHFRRRAINVLALDNHWQGSLKQWVFRLLSPISLRSVYKYCWVPGEPQRRYARKLSFPDNRILTGFYACDLDRFNHYFEQTRSGKASHFPRSFLCVARYIPAKGYERLWKAFIQWQEQQPNEWELWCVGTGIGWEQRIEHPKIRHVGFVQGAQWESVIRETGVFVLNSGFEPWGVVVHEFAAAGYPLLLSNKVGAATRFLRDENGYLHDPQDEASIIRSFERIAALTDTQLVSMGEKSNALARQLSPQAWASCLLSITE